MTKISDYIATLERQHREFAKKAERFTKALQDEIGGVQPPKSKITPQKLRAARAAVASLKAKGKVPTYRNAELESEKLGQKVTRNTISNYHKKGLLPF
jgi:hypothetical protein